MVLLVYNTNSHPSSTLRVDSGTRGKEGQLHPGILVGGRADIGLWPP